MVQFDAKLIPLYYLLDPFVCIALLICSLNFSNSKLQIKRGFVEETYPC